MSSDVEMANAQTEFDITRVQSARILSQEDTDDAPPSNGDSVLPATEQEPVVQVVLSLSKADAEKLLKNVEATSNNNAGSSDGVPAPNTTDTAPAKSATSNRRTSSRLKASEASAPQSNTTGRTTRSSTSTAHPPQNGNPTQSATPPAPPDSAPAQEPPIVQQQQQPQPQPQQQYLPSSIEMQGIVDTERSYTNAFHKTLSLFVDDKTFSTPSLRAAVVGYLESSNATILEILPAHNHAVPEHLRQEVENHVNLIRTVLQRGGVFAEDFLRTRLKKLSQHIPRLEAALVAGSPDQVSQFSNRKAATLVARSNDPYNSGDLDPELQAATENILAQAADAAARSNNRHAQLMQERDERGEMNLVDPNGLPPPPMAGGMPPLPGLGLPPGMALPRGKTFVPPSLVPSGLGPSDGNSPPPVLAPFDPRPNPMACLFCRQRKIRCIGHKPHPCEICVKRGFVCSYDWISRRGKRKPKGADGSPLDVPPGSVTVAAVDQNGPPTVGGVPIVMPPSGPVVHQGPPPAVGMHPHPPPGMAIPMGMPGHEGMPPPQFAYTFLPPGAPPPLGVQFVAPHQPPYTLPPPAHLHQGHPQPPPPPPPPPMHQAEYAAESAAVPVVPVNGVSSAVTAPQAVSGGMMIDPSLMEGPTAPPTASNGNGEAATTAAPQGGNGEGCRFCKEQDFHCGGKPPAPCDHCIRRSQDCVYGEPTRTGRRGKKAAAAVGVGTPSTAVGDVPDSPASSTRKSKRMMSEAAPPPAAKKRQRASKRGQAAAQQEEAAAAAAAVTNGHADEHEGEGGEGDVDMGQEEGATAAA